MVGNVRISKIAVISTLSMWIIVAIARFCIDEIYEEDRNCVGRDYDEIATSQILNVALDENAIEYCIFNANPVGFQLETFDDFCSEHNLELNVIPVSNESEAEKLLSSGECDIIVKHSYVTDSCMSMPLLHSNVVILSQTKDSPDTIYAAGSMQMSVGYEGKKIVVLDSVTQERLARKVSSGELGAVLCDSALAIAYKKAYPHLSIDASICILQKILWKTNGSSRMLLDSINEWLLNEKETKRYKQRLNIYYSYINVNVSSKYYSGNGNVVSAYDDLIRKHSVKLQWDWRYVASLIYEESHFYSDISNPSGAYGLMQLMPAAYQKFAYDSADISNPEIQIMAGINHLDYLKKHTPELISDTSVIIRYVLMGYNAGHGHSEDAYNLAQKYSNNPNSWSSLSKYMTLLNDSRYYSDSVVKCGRYKGSRTVAFANRVVNRYKHYRNLIDR